MTDFHTHILPGMDDGAKDVKSSLAMLEILKKVGFTDVVLSPHFYSNKEPAESFLARRAEAEKLLASALPTDAPRLYLGAEVYLSTLLFNCHELNKLTVNGNYMLTELPYEQSISEMTRKNLERLIYHRDITPVLAHIERYPDLMSEKTLRYFLDMGCRVQMNMVVFADKSIRRKLKKYIEKGYVSTVGSDSHSAVGLEERLSAAISCSEKLFGAEFLHGIGAYAKETLLC